MVEARRHLAATAASHAQWWKSGTRGLGVCAFRCAHLLPPAATPGRPAGQLLHPVAAGGQFLQALFGRAGAVFVVAGLAEREPQLALE
jgi:hypothetical protein